MSKRHDRNVRYFAVARANAQLVADALDRCESALTQLDVGPSNEIARRDAEQVRHRLRNLESELDKLERLVCS